MGKIFEINYKFKKKKCYEIKMKIALICLLTLISSTKCIHFYSDYKFKILGRLKVQR